VFKCASATCGFFYHPECVTKLLHRVVEDVPPELVRNIAKGEPFTCPAHYCCICKEMENKKEHELHFAVCRRCPKSYHRKCLPRKIAFEDIEEEGIVARAWEGLLPNNRILIYCLKHEIDDELGTPIRDHIKFPYVKEKTKPATKEVINKNNAKLEDLPVTRPSAKLSKLSGKMSSGKVGIENPGKISGSNIPRKKANEASRRYLNETKRSILKETERSDYEENQPSLGEQLFSFYQKGSKQISSGNHVDNVSDNTLSVKRTKKLSSAPPQLDADSERRLLALFKEASSSITMEKVIKEHNFASTHAHSLKNVVEKTITVGKLEGSVEAVRTALRMLDDGHSIRDAEAVCGPDVMNRLFKWKSNECGRRCRFWLDNASLDRKYLQLCKQWARGDKLKVYLAPVLHGNRYTSYGRHFTQVEKLEGIVDKLHWYVQNGDTIVDFCCGANDFSRLMKKKLEETGKRCSYKNFDLLPTKINLLLNAEIVTVLCVVAYIF
ncbi:enhanced downy mildew protein, partial [Trifolium pratense]